MKQINDVPIKYGILVASVILVIFVFQQPKLSVWLFTSKQHNIWNTFDQNVRKTHIIDGKIFWQFREFYYPGFSKFERLGFNKKKVAEIEKKLAVRLLPKSNAMVFLIYTSRKFNSFEALVNNEELSKTLKDDGFNREDTILDDQSNRMYTTSKKARIIFIKPVTEMVKANGYYDGKNKYDLEIIKDKYWLSVSEVELP